ncbi:MAG: DNA primase [Ruminococcus sp.]|nr:DNA primase [Ruminococcus sp.]
MALPADLVQRLKDANPIAEVMGRVVSLKWQGRDYVCLCPFHTEKTPSCHVHPDSGYFKCFGCNAGGDVITFTMMYNNLEYMDAVRKLAEDAGLPLPEDRGERKRTDERKRLYEINKAAARFFYSQLRTPEGMKCVDYLMNTRKLTPEVIKKYGMGYAPRSWTALKNHMMAEGFSEEELVKASLLTRSSKGGANTFAFFMDRAMFPFIDLSGRIVGFGGRTLGDDKRKYLNSRDTACYNKNRFLFSMNFAKEKSVKTGTVLLCEGNLDVISLYRSGFENAVASCGTALTEEQAKLISNYAEKVIICYDADEAGQKATARAIGILRGAGLKTAVLKINGAKDPDEYINKYGADHFSHLIRNAEGAVEFELEKCKEDLDLTTDEGRLDCLKRSYGVLAKIGSAVEREIYISKLAKDMGVSANSVENEVNRVLRRGVKQYELAQFRAEMRRITNSDPKTDSGSVEVRSERNIIYHLANFPEDLEHIVSRIKPEEFITDFEKSVYGSLVYRIRNELDISPSGFYDEFSPEEVDKITSLFVFEDMGADDIDVIYDCIKHIKAYNSHAEEKQRDESGEFDPEAAAREFEEMQKKFSQ